MRTRLGPVDAFTHLPVKVQNGSRTCFVVGSGSGFRLLSTVCPHQGGTVHDEGSHFECPLHHWRFDRLTGRCLNAPSRELAGVPVSVEDGVLFADVPGDAQLDRVRQTARTARPGLSMRLHAHACLEIWYEGFTLLTDPWLDGPAFLGAWAQYPPPDVRAADLRPDAILITHEHSDHFHEPTLRHFDRRTPVYVPDFPNRRLPGRLAALGFTDVTPLRFGESRIIHRDWHIEAFEPNSYWNDAFLLIDVDGFRIFDINDAGVNARIAPLVAPVDVVAVQFSAGASGYPWTWEHLSDEQKVAISEQACGGKLKLIREAASLYGAASVLPFASHFTLWHPAHQGYARAMKRNALADVKRAMAGTDVEVIDLLPGDTWDVGQSLIRRNAEDRDGLFESDRIAAYMSEAVPEDTFAAHHPVEESLSQPDLVEYLDRLNSAPEIALCEDLTVRIRALASAAGASLDVGFAIAGGRLTMLSTPPVEANLTITIPLGVLTAVIRDGLSWDEAFIGYWCRFDRHPNVYHAGFWRLLQAPYFKRPAGLSAPLPGGIGRASTVADVLETYGPEADRILRRYGLYCSGCHHSTADSIEMAARQHGVDARRTDLLIRDLVSAFAGSESTTELKR